MLAPVHGMWVGGAEVGLRLWIHCANREAVGATAPISAGGAAIYAIRAIYAQHTEELPGAPLRAPC